jgi:hypothetical protein
MEPFIIIKNYRQSRQLEELSPPPRIFLREIDPNTLPSRQPNYKQHVRAFAEDDKENFNFMLDHYLGDEPFKALPSPSNNQLINYADYDLNY